MGADDFSSEGRLATASSQEANHEGSTLAYTGDESVQNVTDSRRAKAVRVEAIISCLCESQIAKNCTAKPKRSMYFFWHDEFFKRAEWIRASLSLTYLMRQACFSQGTHLARLLSKTGIFRVGKVACTTALHEAIYADEFICFGGWLEMWMCKYNFGLRVHVFNGVNHQ